MTLGDVLAIMLVSALLLIATLYLWTGDQGIADKVVVASGGKIIAELDIHQDTVLDVDGFLGVSRVEVKGGQVRFVDSPCSNRQCILRGWVRESGDTVVCLPNRVSVTITGLDTYYDAVNF